MVLAVNSCRFIPCKRLQHRSRVKCWTTYQMISYHVTWLRWLRTVSAGAFICPLLISSSWKGNTNQILVFLYKLSRYKYTICAVSFSTNCGSAHRLAHWTQWLWASATFGRRPYRGLSANTRKGCSGTRDRCSTRTSKYCSLGSTACCSTATGDSCSLAGAGIPAT